MSEPVRPALRAWLGWRTERLVTRPDGWASFTSDLNRTFVPATWLLMRPYGLIGYLPSLATESKPAHVPDEVALLIYSSTADYDRHKATVGGRSYSVMHRALFEFDDPTRRSRSGWASAAPAESRVQAFHRPAQAGGLGFRHPQAVPMCLILAGPTGRAADSATVFAAIGHERHEAVAVCEADLTVVWVATCVLGAPAGLPARSLADTVATALGLAPSAVVAAHAALPARWATQEADTPDDTTQPAPALVADTGWCFRRDTAA